MTQEEFKNNIYSWAEARNLLSLDSIAQQGLYLIAEIGEAVSEHLKGNLSAMMLELGDVLVVLQVMRLQLGRKCPGDPVPPHGMDTETLLRDSVRYAVSASGYSAILAFYNSTSSEALKQDEQTKLVAVLDRLQEYTCRAIQAIGYTPDQARQAVWEKIANRTGRTVDGVFIKDAPSPELDWIPTAESGHYWARVFEQDGWDVLRYDADAELFYSYMGRDAFDPEELFKIGARVEHPASND